MDTSWPVLSHFNISLHGHQWRFFKVKAIRVTGRSLHAHVPSSFDSEVFFPFSNIIFICIRVARLFYRFKDSLWLPPHQFVWSHPSFHLYLIWGLGAGCSLAARVLAYVHKALGLSPKSPSASVVACLHSQCLGGAGAGTIRSSWLSLTA